MMTMAHDGSRAKWRKARHSGGNGNCVEVAHLNAIIGVRDSKAPDDPHLTFNPKAWSAFVAEVKAGRYDEVRG